MRYPVHEAATIEGRMWNHGMSCSVASLATPWTFWHAGNTLGRYGESARGRALYSAILAEICAPGAVFLQQGPRTRTPATSTTIILERRIIIYPSREWTGSLTW